MPAPVDSPSLFGALLDRERGGVFRFVVNGAAIAPSTVDYLANTNELRSEFVAGEDLRVRATLARQERAARRPPRDRTAGPAARVGFELNTYPEEWAYILRAGSRVSSNRVTGVVFVHGKGDHQRLPLTPELNDVGELIALIETRRLVAFRRGHAAVRSNLVRAGSVVRAWLNSI